MYVPPPIAIARKSFIYLLKRDTLATGSTRPRALGLSHIKLNTNPTYLSPFCSSSLVYACSTLGRTPVFIFFFKFALTSIRLAARPWSLRWPRYDQDPIMRPCERYDVGGGVVLGAIPSQLVNAELSKISDSSSWHIWWRTSCPNLKGSG